MVAFISASSAGFTKASFLPLLDFAYTSTLTFNFSVMADIANLSRHLLMTEVLQICESVHKQVEEQKLMVYQRGDTHTVTTERSALYALAVQSDAGPLLSEAGGPLAQQPVTVEAVEGGAEAVLALVSGSAEGSDTQTVTVVTHSGQSGASESLAVVSACLALEQPHAATAMDVVVNVAQSNVGPSDTVGPASAVAPVELQQAGAESLAQEQTEVTPTPPKRKRGRPAKVKKEESAEEFLPPEDDPSADDSQEDKQDVTSDHPRRRQLRQRSIAEGGYARLHMGLEGEEEGKKIPTPQRSAPPKVRVQTDIRGLAQCQTDTRQRGGGAMDHPPHL